MQAQITKPSDPSNQTLQTSKQKEKPKSSAFEQKTPNLKLQKSLDNTHQPSPNPFHTAQAKLQTKINPFQAAAQKVGWQTKLSIGQPNDPYEQEADRMAEQVLSSPHTLQRKCTTCQTHEIQKKKSLASQISPLREGFAQAKCAACEAEESLQGKFVQRAGGQASHQLESQINSHKGGGSPMDSQTLDSMNQGFGTDFSGVRIHTGSSSVQMNQELGARAFTVGNDIHFNQGEYKPGSQEGKKLLAHELTHTVQQGSTPANSLSPKLIQMSPLSDELAALWNDDRKDEFFNRLRNLNQTDPDVLAFIRATLTGDDLWLAENIVQYGKEANIPMIILMPASTVDQVKFGGGHPLTSYGGDARVNPVWTPGATDHASAFTKGVGPSLEAQFSLGDKLSVAGITSAYVRVKEGAKIIGRGTFAPVASGIVNLALSILELSNFKEVRNKAYTLSWEASVDGVNWGHLGPSGPHLVYWLNAPPLTAPLYNYALNKATTYAAGAGDVPAAIRTGIRGDLTYNPADPINDDPLSVFADGVGICTDFGNLLTLLAKSLGFPANAVMFWGGFQTLGKNVWVSTNGSRINLVNVRSPIAAYNPPANPAGWAFNYHVISRIAGTLHDAALDRTGIEADALHDGKIIHLVELAGTPMPLAKVGDAYDNEIARRDHIVGVSIRDYGSKITTADFTTIIPLSLPPGATSPIEIGGLTWALASGTLPGGLTLDAATGEIRGTPTASGTFVISVNVKAGTVLETTKTITLTVSP